MHKTVPPSFEAKSFNCPHCHAYSHQIWNGMLDATHSWVDDLHMAYCSHCKKYSLWLNKKIIYPNSTGISLPNSDLAKDIQDDYLEAANIVNKSPRGAVALLRLAIQKLCKQLGEDGKNINNDIASLVKKGLPPTIQQALDIVRVVGNDAVHPGQIDLKDNQVIANKLFELINIIAHVMITQPKEIAALYETLPEEKKEAIVTRDK
ncbi:MAG: DUF4145 domain-containing protein [Sulfuricurvum sp.]|uniref:DUF4145 domain-containing protein n=1 Tax=Sulfuricurvum sp. TaxID=2025608 RepID=UPI002735EE94|nr:DUF4145 domain-containing protein [Sulfuricurvum sp.]MDP3291038.1 DUF4145 domain-containing protein [Sulfuricurvum sp.]